jgi:uncharacterized protein
MDNLKFETKFDEYMTRVCEENPDPSHDILHVRRVVGLARKISIEEGADLNVVIPAAYLHDCVYICKTDQRRKEASAISAKRAVELLGQWGYGSVSCRDQISHAIEAHSFSANRVAQSTEAMVVQDADRLDAMGAIGISRCLTFGGLAKRSLYNGDDPFCDTRVPDDSTNTLDHFFTKLLSLQELLNTKSAKEEGRRRLLVMQAFVESLKREIT